MSKIKIKIALPVFFILLVFISGIFIVSSNFFVSTILLTNYAKMYISNVGNLVMEKMINYLKPVSDIVKLNSALLKSQVDKNNYLDHFNSVTMQQMLTISQIALIYYGDESGWFWMNAREINNSISTEVIVRKDDSAKSKTVLVDAMKLPQTNDQEIKKVETMIFPILETRWWIRNAEQNLITTDITKNYIYDPRLRPWYINSVSKKALNWTDAYIFSSSGKLLASGKPGITVSIPIYDRGVLKGVTGADIVLKEMSDFLKTLKIGNSGRAFITNEVGDAIALVNYDEIMVSDDQTTSFNKIEHISDKAIANSFQTLLMTNSKDKAALQKNEQLDLSTPVSFSFFSERNKFLGLYIPFPREIGLNWYVGVVVLENDFIGKMKTNLLIGILISLVIIFIGIMISLYFSNKITQPMNILVKEANEIKDFKIDDDVVVKTIFYEIDQMTDAFANMKSGLRSFKKYVPADLVRILIQSGEEATLGGRYEDMTIFFSDIKDFTNISEKLDPKVLIVHLGEYMDSLSRIIFERKGTVDKYIGDSIMAFWNAPINVENHALNSCLAAIECQNKIHELEKKWTGKNLPVFYTRIGINTGNVVVGNMGSEDRLNYTVLGDTVNIASRVEGLCKQYGTSIIITEETRRYVIEHLVLRKLDKVVVKGKNQGIIIYELTDQKGNVSSKTYEFISVYESALEKYFNREWDVALKYFEKALRIYPADKASVIFINRCRLYKIQPPPPNWDGCFVYTRK